jgi:pyruvate,orthophosphate dikinase
MGRPCVVGAELEIDPNRGVVRAGDVTLHAGDRIAIDGTRGIVTRDDIPLVQPELTVYFETVLGWADELRRLEVRANADTPADARRARGFGAQGIGLCRTEHMFMAADRQPKMRAMILAEEEEERREALAALRPLQQRDFEGLLEAMSGLPVTIRLLDPPLHEFLPQRDELVLALERARTGDDAAGNVAELEQMLDRLTALEETNPMLGTRGCRLGIIHPEIYEMQADAMMAASKTVAERSGAAPDLEIMVPLVGYERELQLMRDLIVGVGERHGMTEGEDYSVGSMIELPRACLLADRIARHSDFFSFGTNDLTQTTLGFSRDDVESKFLPAYLERKIVDVSPFETIDTLAVGELVRVAAQRGRSSKPGLELGICGEHGGDPASIGFFDEIGIDYVSCSPFRVPVARVAAAQAAVRRETAGAGAA